MPLSLVPQAPAGLSRAWQQHALCRSDDAEVFFPPLHFEHKPQREAREAKAKAICARCPVRAPCLEWALATGEQHGIWGGLSELERKSMLAGDADAQGRGRQAS